MSRELIELPSVRTLLSVSSVTFTLSNVTPVPSSMIDESPSVCEPVNTAIRLAVPPEVVTPPPVPAQLASVERQISSV